MNGERRQPGFAEETRSGPGRSVSRWRPAFPRLAFRLPPSAWVRRAGWPSGFVVLTALTQVGGVLCLLGWWLSGKWWQRRRSRVAAVAVFYLVATLGIIPVVARPFGRVALPLVARAEAPVAPRSPLFWFCSRHYVSPEVRAVVVEAARKLRAKHPGSVVHYLDAGFPFWDGFVMLPHWSHRNGKVIDLTFCYEKARDGSRHAVSPSPIGYGIYEGPKEGEPQPYRGRWSWLRWDFAWIQWLNRGNRLDRERTRDLLRYLLEDERTSKVLLETHLHNRLGLLHRKLRFQQLQAARHDDHLHLVVR